jgi:hypothetical protein
MRALTSPIDQFIDKFIVEQTIRRWVWLEEIFHWKPLFEGITYHWSLPISLSPVHHEESHFALPHIPQHEVLPHCA